MARRGENIYKRKDGRYEGRYVIGKTQNGRTKFGYVYGCRYDEVRAKLILRKSEVLCASEKNRGGQISLNAWLSTWLENEVCGSVKKSSYCVYLRQINLHIRPILGSCLLSEIAPSNIQAFIGQMEAKGLAGNTIKAVFRLLKAAMNCARDEGYIVENPCRKIKIQRKEAPEQSVLTASEQKKLRKEALQQNELPTLLGLYTGMRLGEICALQWADIDWEKRTITVRRTAQRIAVLQGEKHTQLRIDSPKSKRSRRMLPIPDFLFALLQKAFQKSHHDNPYIFGKSSQPAEPRTMQRQFQKLVCKLNLRNVHFHTLRHSFATRLMELGVEIQTISTLLGHQSPRTTLEFYGHSLPETQKSAIYLLATKN